MLKDNQQTIIAGRSIGEILKRFDKKIKDYLDFENSKVLSIGPRNEGELYFIRRWP